MPVDITRARRKIANVEKQARFATARALTLTAKDAQQAVTQALPQIFQGPVQFTQRAIAITPARTATLEAFVFAKDRQAEYLAIQEVGGTRTPEPGAPVLHPVQIRTNRSGNIPRGRIKREIAKPNVFVSAQDEPRTRHLPPGIYQRAKRGERRHGGRGTVGALRRGPSGKKAGGVKGLTSLKLLVALDERAAYQARFGFKERVNKVVLDKFPDRFRQSLRHALATAR